jgi:hypothetical protein
LFLFETSLSCRKLARVWMCRPVQAGLQFIDPATATTVCPLWLDFLVFRCYTIIATSQVSLDIGPGKIAELVEALEEEEEALH